MKPFPILSLNSNPSRENIQKFLKTLFIAPKVLDRMPNPARAALLLPNLVQSLELVLGDHNPLKTVAFFTSSSPSRALPGVRLCRASVSGSIARARPPWRTASRTTPSDHRHCTNRDDVKARMTTATRNHRSTPCAPIQAAAECDFVSIRGESRQFLPHG